MGIDYDKIERQINLGVNWVKNQYYNSPGFRLRLWSENNDFNNYRDSEYDPNKGFYNGIDNTNDYYNGLVLHPFLSGNVIFDRWNMGLENNGAYHSGYETYYGYMPPEIAIGLQVRLNDAEDPDNDVHSYDVIAAHEAGHALNESINHVIFDKNTGNVYAPYDIGLIYEDYVNMLPILRKNQYYLNMLSMYNICGKDTIKDIKLFPLVLYLSHGHDAVPGEAYADLVAIRYLLAKLGIYDSTKADNIFTQQHLDKLKALYPEHRFFKMFDDDVIILMMNTVASNSFAPKVPDKFDLNEHNLTTYT